MQLGVLRYARGPYQPSTQQPTYDVGLPQGVVSYYGPISDTETLYNFLTKICTTTKVIRLIELISGSNVILEKLTVTQLVKFPKLG
jgi:hypothetical protein